MNLVESINTSARHRSTPRKSSIRFVYLYDRESHETRICGRSPAVNFGQWGGGRGQFTPCRPVALRSLHSSLKARASTAAPRSPALAEAPEKLLAYQYHENHTKPLQK